jgi:hypothetical protein
MGYHINSSSHHIFFLLERQHKSDVSGIKHYLSSNRWQGEVMQTNIESWKKINARYGNDYFYDVNFFLPNDKQLYTAKSLIASDQAHILKKLLTIKVKKGRKVKWPSFQYASIMSVNCDG